MTKQLSGLALRQHNPQNIPRLGACDDCVALLATDIVKIPASIYRINELELPLSDEGARAVFSSTMSQFAGTDATLTGVSQNTVVTNASAQPFLVRCVAPYVSVEALGFSANGAAITLPTVPGAPGPTPSFDGVVPLAGVAPGLQQAYMQWGQSTWLAVKELFQAYRLTMPLSNTFIVFDELLADIGTPDSHNTWDGFSDSLVAIPEYVRIMNDRTRASGFGKIFIPATVQTLSAPGVTPAVVGGVPTPLVKASWGGPNLKGLYGGCYPSKGVLFMPGQPIYFNYVRDAGESIYYDALIRAITNNPGFTYDASLTGTIGATPDGAPNSGQAEFVKFVGGKMRFGLTVRGANLTPRCVLEWYAMLSTQFGQYYCSTMFRDQMDGMQGCNTLLGISEEQRVTSLKKSDLLRRLANLRKGAQSTQSYDMLTHLAGLPGIDDKDNEATRVAPKESI